MVQGRRPIRRAADAVVAKGCVSLNFRLRPGVHMAYSLKKMGFINATLLERTDRIGADQFRLPAAPWIAKIEL